VAASLRGEPGIKVDVVDGGRGEFTVTVDGREVARKDGDDLPPVEQVLAAVRAARKAAAPAGR
jgi:hypothetical protein